MGAKTSKNIQEVKATTSSKKGSVSSLNFNKNGSKSNSSSKINSPRRSIEKPVTNNRNQKRISKFAKGYEEHGEEDVLEFLMVRNENLDDFDLICDVLNNHFFMRVLDKKLRVEIIKEMSLAKVEKGVTVCKQGSSGNYFYIVKKGKLELFINDNFVKAIESQESFGELALLHSAVRSGTLIATETTFLWCLERKTFRKVVEIMNKLNFEENKAFIKSVPYLNSLDRAYRQVLASSIIKSYYEQGKYIFKDGELANCLYIIKDGQVECMKQGKVIRVLKKGDHFGEKSILTDTPRSMDVVAKSNTILYSISLDSIKSMTGGKYREVLYTNLIKTILSTSNSFSSLYMKLIDDYSYMFKLKTFDKNEIVLTKGTSVNQNMMLILEGSLVNATNNKVIGERGQILFENQLFHSDSKLDFDIKADPDCFITEIKMSDFIKIFGNSLGDLLDKSNVIQSLQKVPLFKSLSLKKLESLMNKIKVKTYSDGEKIIVEGEEGNTLYIVKSGKVDITSKGQYLRTMNQNEYFGERSLFFHEPRSATAFANGDSSLYVLDANDFKLVLENNLKNFLMNRLALQDDKVVLDDLDYIKELGSGSFGSVCLVRNKKTKNFYAIKAMNKTQIDYEKLHENILMEKGILLKIDHPFIVKLVKTLKDNKYIYFLMEYVRGKELWDVIREIGLLNKYQTQFYGASLLVAVDYLHERGVIYRDFKPENVMVADNIIDFGTAKEIKDRTSTIIGTPHYMAPEVILGEGYSFTYDYWSIAVCIYEFFCGYQPFGENEEDAMQVYMAIINQDLLFPKWVKDNEFKNLMTQMLTKNPSRRLFKLSQIKFHPYFKDFNWEGLTNLNVDIAWKIETKEETYQNIEPYIQFMNNNAKAYKPKKKAAIEKSKQIIFDEWFNNF